jgi:hypothetical protein
MTTIETAHREPTQPDARAFWYFSAPGHFYVDLTAHAGQRGYCAQFLAGPGCDPTTITDADVGVVCSYMDADDCTTSAQTFAAVRAEAWRIWDDIVDDERPETSTLPWWAR